MRLVGCLAFLFVSAVAAYPLDLSITPAVPVAGSVVLVTLTGECGTGQERSFGYTIEGRVLTLMVEEIDCPCGQMCTTVCVPFKVIQTVGPLEAGEYTVRGVYRLVNGCTGELITEQMVEKTLLVVLTSPAPLVTFTHQPAYPQLGEEVHFEVLTPSNGESQLVWYGWDWEGDGELDLAIQIKDSEQGLLYEWDYDLDGKPEKLTDHLTTVTHQFTNPGTYRVTLQVRDEHGLEAQVMREIMVLPPQLLPAPRISWEILSQDEDRITLRITLSLQKSLSGRGLTYHWDWDSDGEMDEVLTNPVVNHTFVLPGPFTVTLVVKGAAGEMAGITQTLRIAKPEERG